MTLLYGASAPDNSFALLVADTRAPVPRRDGLRFVESCMKLMAHPAGAWVGLTGAYLRGWTLRFQDVDLEDGEAVGEALRREAAFLSRKAAECDALERLPAADRRRWRDYLGPRMAEPELRLMVVSWSRPGEVRFLGPSGEDGVGPFGISVPPQLEDQAKELLAVLGNALPAAPTRLDAVRAAAATFGEAARRAESVGPRIDVGSVRTVAGKARLEFLRGASCDVARASDGELRALFAASDYQATYFEHRARTYRPASLWRRLLVRLSGVRARQMARERAAVREWAPDLFA